MIELSYDKQKVKEVLSSLGIRVPYGAVLTPEEAAGWNLFPAIVKPSREHCSLTIYRKIGGLRYIFTSGTDSAGEQ